MAGYGKMGKQHGFGKDFRVCRQAGSTAEAWEELLTHPQAVNILVLKPRPRHKP